MNAIQIKRLQPSGGGRGQWTGSTLPSGLQRYGEELVPWPAVIIFEGQSDPEIM